MLEGRNHDQRNKNPDADLGREANEFWWERPEQMAKINGRVMTSLVVDPPTGTVPTLPEMAKARQTNPKVFAQP